MIDGVILERVDDFIYLGSCKTSTGECKTDVERRIAQAKSKMIDLDNIWKDKDLSISLKLKILKVLVWTTVMYGAEGWTLRQEEKKKIQAAEMWFYRILINVTWRQRRTNESILEELKVKRELFGNIVNSPFLAIKFAAKTQNLFLI